MTGSSLTGLAHLHLGSESGERQSAHSARPTGRRQLGVRRKGGRLSAWRSGGGPHPHRVELLSARARSSSMTYCQRGSHSGCGHMRVARSVTAVRNQITSVARINKSP
jgi:hypothetical protein